METIGDTDLRRSLLRANQISRTERVSRRNIRARFTVDQIRAELARRGGAATEFPLFGKKNIPASFWRELGFRGKTDGLAWMRRNNIPYSQSIREMRQRVQNALHREHKRSVYRENLHIAEIDAFVKANVASPNEAFEIRLNPVQVNFGEIAGLNIYSKFENGYGSDAYKDYIKKIVDDGAVILSNGKIVPAQHGGQMLTIFDVTIFNRGGCSRHEGLSTMNLEEAVLTLRSLPTKKVSCFYACLNRIFNKRFNGPPVSLEDARSFVESHKLDTVVRTATDTGFRVNDLFLYQGHYFIVQKVVFKTYRQKRAERQRVETKQKTKEKNREKDARGREPKAEGHSLLFYDLETVVAKERSFEYVYEGKKKKGYCLKPRLCAFEYCVDLEKNVWKKQHYYGYDCVDRFLAFLRLNERSRFNVYAHNGSRFDHYFLLARMENLHKYKIKFQGSKIFSVRYYNHTFKDTSLLLPLPLDTLSRDFRTEVQKKTSCESLGMSSYQLCAVEDDFIEAEENSAVMDAYIDYCICDVTSLRMVFMKYREEIKRLAPWTDLVKAKTAPGLAKIILDPAKEYLKSLEEYIGNDPEKNAFVRASIRGGISHSRANKDKRPYRTSESITGVDINSQYPWALTRGRFPAGPSYWETDKERFENRNIENEVGFVEISDIRFRGGPGLRLIPYRNERGSLEWYYHDENPVHHEKVVVPTCLLSYIVPESYTFHRALLSEKSLTGKRVYGQNIGKLYAIKQQEDEYKNENDLRYNPALRTAVKIMLNSYYGKTVENYSKHMDMVWCDNPADGEKRVLGASYTTTPSKRINNMVSVGSIVLALSKILLSMYVDRLPPEGVDEIFQIETDGFYFPSKYYAEFEKNVAEPSLFSGDVEMGSNLGGLKLEKQTLEGEYSYTIGKKLYFLANHRREEYGDDDMLFTDKSCRELRNRCEDFRISGVPIYEYNNGTYSFVVHPSSYEKAYDKKMVDFSWNKLARDLETMSIGEIQQTRSRGFL